MPSLPRNYSKMGVPIIFCAAIINVFLWLVFGPENPDARVDFANQYWSEILSSSSMILMALGFVLAARPKFLEPLFGGLDQMYKAHKLTNIIAMWLLIGHFVTIPESGDEGIGPKLGMVAFVGMVVLVLITIAPKTPLKRFIKLPYHKWKNSHRVIGLFYILGIIHTFNVENVIKYSEIASIYCRVIVFIGAFAWVYKSVFYRWMKKQFSYRVKEVNRLNETVVEFTLQPIGNRLQHRAGQFLFISIDGDPKLKEAHPFTISSSPRTDELSLTIKAGGDFTNYLYKRIEPIMEVTLDGAYGMFDYKTGGDEQIWIAGGIGVTPFLSWVRELNGAFSKKIDFFYCVKNKEEDLFSDEINEISKLHDKIKFHTFYSDDNGHINVEMIKAIAGPVTVKDIYLCGPLPMTIALGKQLKDNGVVNKNIHFEEFNLR